MPATSPPAIMPRTSTVPIETHQRIAVLRSSDGDGDTQPGGRKAGTCVVLHIPVSGGNHWTSREARFRTASENVIVAEKRRTSGGVAGMIDTVVKPRTKVKTKTERPKLHKVILVNDDYTPREFVVTVLKAEFRMNEDQAHKVMITAHRRGVCVVAVFTRDVAETKATRATDAGRAKGYPLLFTTEPEE